MKTEFALALKQVITDKNLPEEIIIDALKDAMVSAYRRSVNASSAQKVEAEVDLETGDVTVFVEKEVVDDVQDDRTEVTLVEAKKYNPETEYGDLEMVESTPRDFGRVAAQTARQVIQQRIRQAERQAQYEFYSDKVGEIVTGVVQAVHRHELTIGLNINAEGKMPRSQQIPREHYRVHDRIRALLLDIEETTREPRIILSRAHRDFLRRLLENEVPEIYQGLVEIRSIAREAGYRSKVAVAALKPGVDPVGACVGVRGVRIQAIVRELSDEKIDVIEWNPNTDEYIAKALSPARVLSVFLNKETDAMPTATVVVPEDQLSLAIGRNGQNARLAAKLTGWRIDIKGLFEATSDTLFRLHNDPNYREYLEDESEVIPKIEAVMAKKDEGRPISPEEYRELHYFNSRVEAAIAEKKMELAKRRQARIKAVKEAVPADAYELPIMTLGLPTKVENLLLDADLDSVGKLAYRLLLIPDSLLEIDGIGPTYVEKIEKALKVMVGYEPLPEELDVDMSQFGKEVAIPAPVPPAQKEPEPEKEQEEPKDETEQAAEGSPPEQTTDDAPAEAAEDRESEEEEALEAGEAEAEDLIPADAYDLPILTLGLSPDVESLLQENGWENVGQLAAQFQKAPQEIGEIEGINEDELDEILNAIEVMVGFRPEPLQSVDEEQEGPSEDV